MKKSRIFIKILKGIGIAFLVFILFLVLYTFSFFKMNYSYTNLNSGYSIAAPKGYSLTYNNTFDVNGDYFVMDAKDANIYFLSEDDVNYKIDKINVEGSEIGFQEVSGKCNFSYNGKKISTFFIVPYKDNNGYNRDCNRDFIIDLSGKLSYPEMKNVLYSYLESEEFCVKHNLPRGFGYLLNRNATPCFM